MVKYLCICALDHVRSCLIYCKGEKMSCKPVVRMISKAKKGIFVPVWDNEERKNGKRRMLKGLYVLERTEREE